MGDVFSKSCTSSLVKGFENAAPAWLAQAQTRDAPPLVSFGVFRGYILKADAIRHVVSHRAKFKTISVPIRAI